MPSAMLAFGLVCFSLASLAEGMTFKSDLCRTYPPVAVLSRGRGRCARAQGSGPRPYCIELHRKFFIVAS